MKQPTPGEGSPPQQNLPGTIARGIYVFPCKYADIGSGRVSGGVYVSPAIYTDIGSGRLSGGMILAPGQPWGRCRHRPWVAIALTRNLFHEEKFARIRKITCLHATVVHPACKVGPIEARFVNAGHLLTPHQFRHLAAQCIEYFYTDR